MKILTGLFFSMLSFALFAQSVIINPDGTHSVVHGQDETKVLVNPDGTHSIILGSGDSKILVNPDGTHSQVLGSGNSKIIVNPNGTHSILLNERTFQQEGGPVTSGLQAFFAKRQKSKMITLPDGSILYFENLRQKSKSIKKPLR